MIIKIKAETEKEIEIEFPAYFKYAGYVKIVSPDSYINTRVENGEWIIEKLKNIPHCVSGVILKGKPCTEREFAEAYQKALEPILHEAFMQGKPHSYNLTINEFKESIR